MRELFVTRQFEKDLSRVIRVHADQIILKLRENPLNSALKVKKLSKVDSKVYRV